MKKMDEVLVFLRRSKDQFVSGEDISQSLKVSRAAVWKEIQSLRALGYEIEALSNTGYRLTGRPDKLFSDEISEGLGTSIIGKKIFSYESLDSTNDAVFKLGEEGLPEGAVVFAEEQKKGRGRLGRTWESPKGRSVLFSYLLRPNFTPSQISRITLVTALSIARALKTLTGVDVGIKWPNDILFEGKKLCGILTEMSAETDRIKFVVVGAGINLNSRPEELPPGATSIFAVSGKKVDRIQLCQVLLREIEKDYLRLKKVDFSEIAREWEENSVTTGKRVVAKLLDRKIEGQAVGIDQDGALWIRKDNGIQERVLSGDIEHLR